jgi:predicted solute-binding protein
MHNLKSQKSSFNHAEVAVTTEITTARLQMRMYVKKSTELPQDDILNGYTASSLDFFSWNQTHTCYR